jgi:hypothetical protein
VAAVDVVAAVVLRAVEVELRAAVAVAVAVHARRRVALLR